MTWAPRLVDGDVVDIPDFTKDVAGHIVDLRGPAWRVNIPHRNSVLNWARLHDCDQDAVAALRVHIVRALETRSGSHVENTFREIGRYLLAARDSEWDPSSLSGLLRYLTQLRDGRIESQFHIVRYWYVESANRGLAGFSDDAVFALRELRISGNAKGFAVLSSDPDEGPLSEFEEEALRSALIRDDGPIQERAAIWLAFAYGANPANLCLLREEDFVSHTFADPLPSEHFLNIPRIKKRTPPRSEFKKRYVSAQLALILQELIAWNRAIAPDDTVRPLFRSVKGSATRAAGPLSEYAFHRSSYSITDLVARCARRLGVLSPRSGERLVLTTRRLRYTFACKMVRQGVGARELAELLDHTDLQNVHVYYKADSRMVERLDSTIAIQLGPSVGAFLGEIVPSAGKLIDLISSRDLRDLGQCAAPFICGLSAPNNCYTCVQFRPFKDGPHEDVLEALVDDRERLLEAGHERMAEQLDRTILAAGEVIARIRNGESAG